MAFIQAKHDTEMIILQDPESDPPVDPPRASGPGSEGALQIAHHFSPEVACQCLALRAIFRKECPVQVRDGGRDGS
jgi:hypothetical protein